MCLTPINLKKETFKQKLNDTYHMQQVPCGRCLECLKARVNSWFVRLNSQLSVAKTACFLTVTYEDNHLPFSPNGLVSLDYSDWQGFVKRLRFNQHGREKVPAEERIKYFAVGEYGEKSDRPHYHAIMFNADREKILETWDKGHVHIGEVQPASIYYTLKYALKRAGKIKKSDPWDDRVVEKALMSKGLGLNYLSDEMVQYHKDDVSRPTTLLGNKKVGLPRYYREKIFTPGEKLARNKLLQPFNNEKLEKTYDPLFPQRVAKAYSDTQKKIAKTD